MCEHFWAFLRAEITDFPTLSYTSTREIPTLLHARSPEINVPRIVKYMEYTPPPPPPRTSFPSWRWLNNFLSISNVWLLVWVFKTIWYHPQTTITLRAYHLQKIYCGHDDKLALISCRYRCVLLSKSAARNFSLHAASLSKCREGNCFNSTCIA